MERWEGKVAVVTGATGGIGSAIVKALSDCKLKVIGLDINIPEEKTSGSMKVLRKCDITNLEDLRKTFSWIEETSGGVDIMVNCAGSIKFGHITSLSQKQISDEEVARIMDLNVKALILCSRLAVDSMTKRSFDGHIINICSTIGHYIPMTDEMNVYTSSKYAVRAFSESLANELATFKSKIRTTNISPGLVKTPLSTPYTSNLPYLEPQEIANAVVYAISTPPYVNITQMTISATLELKS